MSQVSKPVSQPAVCVLGRAMNLHNLRARPAQSAVDTPAAQVTLFLISLATFAAFFVG